VLTFVKNQFAAGVPVVVTDLVVSEAYLALHAHYDVPKKEAVRALLEMLRSGIVQPADGPVITKVLDLATRSPTKPGFVDRLIHAQYERSSASMVTFEHAAKRLRGTMVL
jgi:hypothetical protein